MEEEILNLICNYSQRNTIVDKKYIEKLVAIVSNAKSLNKYVRYISWDDISESSDNSSNVLATYNIVNRNLKINFSIIKKCLERFNKHNSLFSKQEQIFLRNLEVTQIVLHEMEHASQNKKLDQYQSNNIDLETRLLLASCDADQQLGDKFYIQDPLERLADIKAFKIVNIIFDQIDEHMPNLKLFERISLVQSLLRGYSTIGSRVISPTDAFLDGTKQSYVKLFLTKGCFYSMNDKLLYGLSVTKDEYDQTNETYYELCRQLHAHK